MLRRRLQLLGAGFGLINGLVFTFLAPVLIPVFPGPEEPLFLLFLFLVTILSIGIGTLAGERLYRRAIRSAPEKST